MAAQIGIIALLSLLVGLVAGYILARRSRTVVHLSPPPAYDPLVESEDTRPTLVPFPATREMGRNLARIGDPQPDHLDKLLAELDKR